MSEELKVWIVAYGNYEPDELDSIWFSREEAEQHADEMEGDWRVRSKLIHGVNRVEDILRKKLEIAMEALEVDKAEPYNLDTHPIIKRATEVLAAIAKLG